MASEDGTERDVTSTAAGVAAAGLDNSLQLQTCFFPFAQSEKKTKKKTEELTQIGRECVRNEITLQRSGSSIKLYLVYLEFATL